ncbi:S8 family peptidase [Metabacillus bambusae]|uniref:S8 family peptidase n=1 Tax=Metabacillus bambusae TaxID=2795218 RepID=A0ABS3N0U0_9BACI|nr:S8 family peptidase [Metabacillus bambusae]MBO1511775.1 S8 family peptidase [Metabacillus bambusae]
MRTFYFLFFIISLFVFSPTHDVQANEQDTQRYIILFTNSINKDLINHVDGEIIHEFETLPAATVVLPTSKIDLLNNDPSIQFISEEQETQISQQTIDWGYTEINPTPIHQSGFTGKGKKIAVIDTGVVISHPDLKIKGGKSFVDYTTSYNDDNGHGTHVTGIINAQNNSIGTIGIAYDADIYMLKAFNNEGIGNTVDLAHAIDWAITNNMDMINLSIGFDVDDPFIRYLVKKAYQNDILIVAAAGNKGKGNDTITFPARYDEAIAVGAINENNTRASFSSTGPTLEVTAPGDEIYSTYLGNEYQYMSGTSMATPYVTGYLALFEEANPNLSNSEIRTLLHEKVVDLGTTGFDHEYGFGLISNFIDMEQNQGQDQDSEQENEQTFIPSDKFFKVLEPSAIYIKENNQLVRVGRLSTNESFPRIRDYGPNWHEIKYGAQTAYVKKEFTVPSDGSTINNLDTTTKHSQYTIKPKENIAVYDNSSGELVNFGAIYTNVSFPIISDYGNWYKIKFIDRIGFIRKKDVQLDFSSEIKFFKVNTPTAIYQNLDGNLVRVGRVYENQVYPRIRDYGPNWHEIQFGNGVAYVKKSYTTPSLNHTPENLNTTYKDSSKHVKPRLNIAVYDNSSGSLVQYGAIYSGVSYPIVSDYGNWYRVRLAERIGYIRKKDVTE